jgi:phosphate transport system substrate-binding protein
MNKNPSGVRDELKVCSWCGYDANFLTATTCEVCNRPLGKAIPNRKKSSLTGLGASLGLPSRLLSLSALVLLAGGVGYWLWNQQLPDSLPATAISNASDIRIYRTMKDVPNVPKGLFNYHTALTFAAIRSHGMSDAIQNAHPEFQLRFTEPLQGFPGSTAAVRLLIDGEVSIAQTARPLEDSEFERAKVRNLTLEQIPVAIDGVVFYTNPDVSIPGLSIKQAQDIYSGKITNWKQIGGSDLPIVPVSIDPKAGATPKQALGDVGENLGNTVRIVRDFTQGMRQVAATPGSISFASGLIVLGQKSIRLVSLAKGNSHQYVSPVTETGAANQKAFRDGSYPVTRRLFTVILRNRSLDEQAGVAYANLFLSEEGQQIIENAGFVPLY